ncbi:DUF2958 domain-containing protein [Kordiimonas pumila]|uniref:DUF2958 domain-containing protein n=1 Tax=Kordiimonas pumila TaxID=2161677 RepID=A0ABV7D6R5_9PROT|nr:DUF2958 domain-containing protein [Kordiimonas pumila]
MKLLTKAIAEKLDKNWPDDSGDCVPVLKIFNPCGAATWLITCRDPENPDYLWGLCDLGLGFPELGTVLLSELQSVKCPPFGLGLERDLHFTAEHGIKVYAQAARAEGRITFNAELLEAAATQCASE